MRNIFFTLFFVSFLAASNSVTAQTRAAKSSWIQGGEYRLHIRVYKSHEINKRPALVVVLHGDAPFHKPDYQYTFASRVATSNQNVVAVGLLRPGYTDPYGNTSEGVRGKMNGDNWNAKNTDAIADAIHKFKQRYNANRVVVAGHSGGAAITANILGRHPKLIDAALLVSCPCDVERWREHMFELTGKAVFQGDIETLSPIEQIEGISDHANIVMIVGSRDKVAPLYLSKSYQAKAQVLGKSIRLIRLEDKGHNIFLEPEVLTILATMLQ